MTKAIIKPSLAANYEAERAKGALCYPYYAQPKIDGVRVLVTLSEGEVVLYSRPRLSLIPDKDQVTWDVYEHGDEDVVDYWFECDNCGCSYSPRKLDEMLKTGALKFVDE